MRILIVSGDAGESLEIFYPKFRLEEEGWYVAIAAPEKRMFQSVVHDFEPGFDTYTEKLGYRVQADLALNEVDPTTLMRWFCPVDVLQSICVTTLMPSRLFSILSSSKNRSPQTATAHCYYSQRVWNQADV